MRRCGASATIIGTAGRLLASPPDRKTGRPIVLSVSPGPTALEHGAEVAEYAQMWRISDDHWDGWTLARKPTRSEDAPPDCAERIAGTDGPGTRRRGSRICADVAHQRRSLGRLDACSQAHQIGRRAARLC